MPLRAYEPLQSPCRLCGAGFEVMQKSGEAALRECPRCGQPVRPRAVQATNSPRVTRPVSTSDAKAAGFTVLRRTPGGELEKQ